jgi:hypothetical protein
MVKQPRLLLRFDVNGFAMSGRCSACAEVISLPSHVAQNKETATKLLEDEFRSHVKRKHPPRQDVNQAAARIVRAATEK